MNATERFAQNLAEQREKAGLAPEDLARRASISPTQLRSIERGEEEPALETLAKLSGSLQVSIAVLLVGLDWDPVDGLKITGAR
jgi:transcriptional regulator with XRE-family HTH domain